MFRDLAQDRAIVVVRAALPLLAADGDFGEGGGHDTSYQGVALVVGEEVVLAGYDSDALYEGLALVSR